MIADIISHPRQNLSTNCIFSENRKNLPAAVFASAEQMQSLYEKTSKLRQLDGKLLERGLDGLKDFIAENKVTMPAVGKVTANLIGYGEGKLDDDGFSTVKAELYLIVKCSKTVQGPTVIVGIIPVTYSVKIGVDAKLSAAGGYDTKRAMFTGDLSIVLTPNLEAFRGAGVGSLVGVGVYGGGKLPIGIQLAGTSATAGFNYVDLTGELGLKAYAACLTYKKAWAYKTWHIYTRTGSVHSLSDTDTPWLSGFYEVSVTREDLDGAEAGMIRFELETQAQDYDVLNDTCEVYVRPSFHEKIEIRAVEAASVQVKVKADTAASLWAAVYVEGRLENVISQQVGPDTDTVRLALDTASLPAGSVIKVFLIDPETGSPRAQSVIWTIPG